MYEQVCHECGQIYDEGMFRHGAICDYCWAMMGLDYAFSYEEVKVFGTIPGASNFDFDFMKRGNKNG